MGASSRLKKLSDIGQSVWYDNISRQMLQDGSLAKIVENGVVGLTSNPTIFEKAIGSGTLYDADIRRFSQSFSNKAQVFENLAVDDIKKAAELMLPIYQDSQYIDGMVSLEVNPHLANNTGETIIEAKRLHKAVGMPNLMVKVPATPEGIPAIKALIGEGINVNVTLIFSTDMYSRVRDAYIDGLGQLLENGGDISSVSSVASFFVSRVDTSVDTILSEMPSTSRPYIGKTALANARIAYDDFRRTFQNDKFKSLAEKGAKVQRPLWASTSTKNPEFHDLLYVDSLIGPDTVNTMPDATLEAYIDHGNPTVSITDDIEDARTHIDILEKMDIDLTLLTERLLKDGVKSFADSFDQILVNIGSKQKSVSL